MEWVDRVGLTFWVVVVAVVLVVGAVIGWRLIRIAAAARRGEFSSGPKRNRTGGPRSQRSPSARGSSLRPDAADRVYLLDDTPPSSADFPERPNDDLDATGR
ncbi:hypothetical protein NVV95_11535 [Herbiconiux sp. CPCC 205716]|uniref:Uncharacterized protein n=1 Tax=Herbiconiux gentiana TaxID=2970912 RepID=A0ABT2GG67_9MICO|nr:hypothetical protein [Herbiconiux gentiana]MCS5715182.1 hypothetical protein [Herbiconiux gentiana]